VFDASGRPGTVRHTRNNRFVEVPTPGYENLAGLPGDGADDKRIDHWPQWGGGVTVSTAWADEIEQLLLAGSITPAEARLRWFEAYRPAAASHD
jgi:hypothetical protein